MHPVTTARHSRSRPLALRRRPSTFLVGAVSVNVLAAGGILTAMLTANASVKPPSVATVVRTDQSTPASSLSSGPVSTTGSQLMVAFLASDSKGSGATFGRVSGCGLSWHREASANAQAGPVEIWSAFADSSLHGCSVHARRTFGSFQGSITVVGYAGASGVGASASASGVGAPSVTLKTTAANSLVAAVGNDWDNATKRIPASSQSVLSQFLSPSGDTYWVQTRDSVVDSPSRVTLSDSAPGSDRFNLAAVEILAATTSPSQSPTPTPKPTPKPTPTPTPTPKPVVTPSPSPTPPAKPPVTLPTPTLLPTPAAPGTGTFPNASNTGVPAGTVLTLHSGDLAINTAGTVINALDITGTVAVNANNVTIENSRIRGSNYWGILIKDGVTGTKVTDTEINGGGVGSGTPGSDGIQGPGTFLRLNIYGVENGINATGPYSLTDSYVHDLGSPGEPHYDCVQNDGGMSNITIEHDTLLSPDQNSAVMVDNGFGPISNVTVDNSLLAGGNYTVYSDSSQGSGRISGISFTNNRLRSGYFGYADFNGNTPVWSGNVDDVTGKAISAP
jgi:hypothetical protein